MRLTRTLVPVSTLPAAEVQAQATLQTRLDKARDKGYFSKSVTPQYHITKAGRHVRLTGRTPSTSVDGSVLKVCNTNGDGRVGAVVVDLGPDQHQALQHAECKASTYGKALLGLASLLYSSSALGILVFKEFRFNDAIPQLSESKAAAPVGTGLLSYGSTGLKGVIVTTPLPFEARPQPPAQPTPRLFGASKDTQPTRNLRQGHARRGPSRQWTRELVHVLCWPAGRLRPVLRFRSVCLGGCRASPMSRPVTYRSLITHISHLLQILRRCIHVR